MGPRERHIVGGDASYRKAGEGWPRIVEDSRRIGSDLASALGRCWTKLESRQRSANSLTSPFGEIGGASCNCYNKY
eukprot:2775766-Pyramimonas_sp.AAC.1